MNCLKLNLFYLKKDNYRDYPSMSYKITLKFN